MRYIFKLLFLTICLSCGNGGADYINLKSENKALKEKVELLTRELDSLKTTASALLSQAKNEIASANYTGAKKILTEINCRFPTAEEAKTASRLLTSVVPKAEDQLYLRAEKQNDVLSFNNYLEQYPKGKYVKRARSRLKKLDMVSSYSNNSAQERNTITTVQEYQKTPREKKRSAGNTRTGAICCDGTRSYATGRGACSHHGGVCEWLYQ